MLHLTLTMNHQDHRLVEATQESLVQLGAVTINKTTASAHSQRLLQQILQHRKREEWTLQSPEVRLDYIVYAYGVERDTIKFESVTNDQGECRKVFAFQIWNKGKIKPYPSLGDSQKRFEVPIPTTDFGSDHPKRLINCKTYGDFSYRAVQPEWTLRYSAWSIHSHQ